jgi:hypothetical protein
MPRFLRRPDDVSLSTRHVVHCRGYKSEVDVLVGNLVRRILLIGFDFVLNMRTKIVSRAAVFNDRTVSGPDDADERISLASSQPWTRSITCFWILSVRLRASGFVPASRSKASCSGISSSPHLRGQSRDDRFGRLRAIHPRCAKSMHSVDWRET